VVTVPHSVRSQRNAEEVIIANKTKDGWSVRVTGEFDSAFLTDIFEDLDAEENQPAFELQGVLIERMADAGVDAQTRDILWADGQRLSLRASIERLGREYPGYPFDLLERQFIVWLESFSPESYTQAQLDELDTLCEDWLDDYAREYGFDRL
jgi:hypothetical protein